jgi:hypothetical protein
MQPEAEPKEKARCTRELVSATSQEPAAGRTQVRLGYSCSAAGECAAEAIFCCPTENSHNLKSKITSKEPAFHNEKESRRTWPRCHVSLEKSSKNYKPLKKMSQTKPHPSIPPPPPAKSDGKYFPRVFHVVIPDPPNSPAVLTRHSGSQNQGRGRGDLWFDIAH